jgi:hypothetical protein
MGAHVGQSSSPVLSGLKDGRLPSHLDDMDSDHRFPRQCSRACPLNCRWGFWENNRG